MYTSRLRRRSAGWCILAGLCLVGSCSILDPDPSGIVVRNRTGTSIAVLAWELESTHRLDLSPSVTVSSCAVQVIDDGASRFLAFDEISGGFRRGDDLRLFIFEVLGLTAEYRRVVTVSASRLGDRDYEVTLR
jgi:hypothetical protein